MLISNAIERPVAFPFCTELTVLRVNACDIPDKYLQLVEEFSGRVGLELYIFDRIFQAENLLDECLHYAKWSSRLPI
jgi:hypothetical protein